MSGLKQRLGRTCSSILPKVKYQCVSGGKRLYVTTYPLASVDAYIGSSRQLDKLSVH
jgi:hypothetical protein